MKYFKQKRNVYLGYPRGYGDIMSYYCFDNDNFGYRVNSSGPFKGVKFYHWPAKISKKFLCNTQSITDKEFNMGYNENI